MLQIMESYAQFHIDNINKNYKFNVLKNLHDI